MLADQTLLTDTPIAPGGSQTLSPPAGTTSLILQASTDSSIRRTVSLYDTTQPTVTITGADGVDAQPQVVTPPAADPGAVTIVNQQTSTALNAGWAGGPTTKILAWDGEGSPPSADFDTAQSGTSPPPSAWYLDWEDTGDPDPKVVVKHLATTNGRGRPH